MKQSRQVVCKSLALWLCLISIGAYGQKQSKTYSEKFTVDDDAILNIDTSHANIEFETWNKDQIAITATVELDDATPEEAKKYFDNQGIEILGNSTKVSITTGSGAAWDFHSVDKIENLHIEIPELPEFESFEMDFDMAELSDVPPAPPVPDPNFDYEAFQKDGEAYLKKWQKNFQKNFGEPYQKSMEEWQEKMAAKREDLMAERAKMLKERMEVHADRGAAQADRTAALAEARAKLGEKRAELHHNRMEINASRRHRDSISKHFIELHRTGNRPNVFYFNSNDEHRNYKVKKTIKIKMPKATKVKMNVRHGEVKMAGNTKNMDATLSHSSLLAAVIDGDKTKVTASYTPVSVQQWNYGDLEVAYSENVDLHEVLNIHLDATSSEVTITNLANAAFIQNDFGPLLIKSISDDFKTLDVSMQNATLTCKLPSTPFDIYVNGSQSEFVSPDMLQLEKTDNHGSMVYKGFSGRKNSDKTITINSKYSEVVLE